MRNRVKELREEKGMSIEELSVRSGVPIKNIQELEERTEDDCSVYTGLALAKALETIFEEIFTLEKEN